MVKRNKNRGFVQNKKEILNTKLKTVCVEKSEDMRKVCLAD